MPTASQFVRKKSLVHESGNNIGYSTEVTLGGELGMPFKFLKRGHKGRLEARQLVVPKTTNLAKVASKQDDKAARERNILKQRVLRYERSSEQASSGNVYINQLSLPHVRNRPLLIEDIDRNFGSTSGEFNKKLNKSNSRTFTEKFKLPQSHGVHKNNLHHGSDKRRVV